MKSFINCRNIADTIAVLSKVKNKPSKTGESDPYCGVYKERFVVVLIVIKNVGRASAI